MPKLTKTAYPHPLERVLLWRKDSKLWEVARVSPEYIGHPEYAYTHWKRLPPPPKGAI